LLNHINSIVRNLLKSAMLCHHTLDIAFIFNEVVKQI